MNRSRTLARALCSLMVFLSVPSFAKEVFTIFHGWGSPTIAQLVENVKVYEAEAPFDGITVEFGLDPFGAREVSYRDFRDKVRQYKHIRFSRYRHNFIRTLVDQNEPSWFDDKAWKRFVKNWAVAAEVAEKTGADGIVFDPECYGTYPVNNYWSSAYYLKTDKERTKEEYLAKARERGRQMGEAMFKKNPGLVFFGLYLYSMKGDLLAELCNGMLEVMPPTAKLVDGDEWRGYCAKGRSHYKAMEENVANGYGMISKEAKRKKQHGLAPAFYLDAYSRPEDNGCQTKGSLKGNPVRVFKDNLLEAKKAASGGYVWIYGEQGSFWSTPKAKTSWEEQLPGIGKVLFGKEGTSSGHALSSKGSRGGGLNPKDRL